MIYDTNISLLRFPWQSFKLSLVFLLSMSPALGLLGNVSPAEQSVMNYKAEDAQVNLTNEEIARALRAENYIVKELPDEPPIAFIGDIMYPGDELLLHLHAGRHSPILQASKLWLKDGVAQSWYFYDTVTRADKNVFEGAVKTWADKTCIVFNRVPDGPCSRTVNHGTVCVGNFGGCHSNLGNIYSPFLRRPQKMSVQPNGCELVAAAHEFGHALGFNHQQSRPDRDQFMQVRHENFEVKMNDRKNKASLSGHSAQGMKCGSDQTQDFPLPFDYMSVMMYVTHAFGDSDSRSIFTAKDAHYQYIVDYHRPAGLAQSHYDLYTANVAYGCEKKWKAKCENIGKYAPKCANLGYVGKDCKCKCPDGFSGTTCATQGETLYPVRPKAKVLDVTEPQVIDLSKFKFSIGKEDGVLDTFKSYQYFTVIAKANENMLIVMDVIQNQKAFNVLRHFQQDFIVKNQPQMDCKQLLKLYWGVASQFQIRTECLSSVHNFELAGPQLRSWSNQLDFYYYNAVGTGFGEPRFSVELMTFQVNVTFHENPNKYMAVEEENPHPAGFQGGWSSEAARAARAGGGSAVLTAVLVSLLLLLLLIGGSAAAYWFWHRKKISDEDEGHSETASGSKAKGSHKAAAKG